MRARTRSPGAAAVDGPRDPLPRPRWAGAGRTVTTGAMPCSSGHSAGRATRSAPWPRAVISRTATAGREPGRRKVLRSRSMWPSSSSDRKRSFRATRASPLSPKAFAMSRLVARSGLSERKRRSSSRSGRLPRLLAVLPLLPVFAGGLAKVRPSFSWRRLWLPLPSNRRLSCPLPLGPCRCRPWLQSVQALLPW